MVEIGRGMFHLKKSFLIMLCVAAALCLSFLLFVKSPLFLHLVENSLTKGLGKNVSIGSLSFSPSRGFFIKDLIVREEERGESLAIIPHLEIGVSLGGFLKRTVDKVVIKKPKLILKLGSDINFNARSGKLILPLTINSASIEGGEIHLKPEKGEVFFINDINLLLEGIGFDKRTMVKGDAFVPLLDSTLSFKTELDISTLTLDKGYIDLGLVELEKFSPKNLNLPLDKKLKGSVRLKVNILEENKEGLGFEILSGFKNLDMIGAEQGALAGMLSGEFNALIRISRDYQFLRVQAEIRTRTPLFEDGEVKAILNGTYDASVNQLKIENSSVSSPSIGLIKIDGNLDRFPEEAMAHDINLEINKVSLSNLNRHLLQPLGIEIKGFEYKGIVNGSASIDGSLRNRVTLISELFI